MGVLFESGQQLGKKEISEVSKELYENKGIISSSIFVARYKEPQSALHHKFVLAEKPYFTNGIPTHFNIKLNRRPSDRKNSYTMYQPHISKKMRRLKKERIVTRDF